MVGAREIEGKQGKQGVEKGERRRKRGREKDLEANLQA